MSVPPVFFDTTVLVYAAVDEDWRTGVADELIARGGYLSVQVLSELTAVVRRKLRMSFPEVKRILGSIRGLCAPPTPVTIEVHERALGISERYGYHIYDALMIASALEANCSLLYSEDMQDGQKIDSLTIRNPFAHSRKQPS